MTNDSEAEVSVKIIGKLNSCVDRFNEKRNARLAKKRAAKLSEEAKLHNEVLNLDYNAILLV